MGQLQLRGSARNRSPELFLSHRSADKSFVRRLAQDLAFVGVDAWLDEWELEVGDELHESIAAALDSSKFVAVVVGSKDWDSKWVRREMNAALNREFVPDKSVKVVLPILAGDGEVPVFLRDRFHLDFRSNYYSNLIRLCAAVRRVQPKVVATALESNQPASIRDASEILRSIGITPMVLLDSHEYDLVASLGQPRVVNGLPEVWFNHKDVLRDKRASEYLQSVMRRYDETPQRQSTPPT